MTRRLQVDVKDILGVLDAKDSNNISESDSTVQEEVILDSAANKVFNNEVLMTLLSDFVDVADVGRFAGINRVTKSVLDTPMFWKKLYRRKRCSNLPPELRPAILNQSTRGLRAKVIRALQGISNKEKSAVTDRKLQSLVGSTCFEMGREQGNIIYFKLKDAEIEGKGDKGEVEKEENPGEEQDPLRKMSRKKKSQIEDLFHNDYEGFRMLIISTTANWDYWEYPKGSVKNQKLKSLFWDRPKQMFVMKFDSGTETDYCVYIDVHCVMLFNWWDHGNGFRYNIEVEG